MITGYYYLHENRELIFKRELGSTYEDLIDSPFVMAIFPLDPHSRKSAWDTLVLALAAGASKKRVDTLATKWNCTDTDARTYAERIGCVLGIDGNQKTAHRQDFVNLQESPCGFGDTYLEAMANLARSLGYTARSIFIRHFEQLLA